ncbi:MAG: hypothetical protein ACKN9U_02895, partial [Pirellulaceae bacterium]
MEILFEDDSIWVLAKPAAMLTVPTTWGESNTLQGWATKRLQRQVPGGKACCVQRCGFLRCPYATYSALKHCLLDNRHRIR